MSALDKPTMSVSFYDPEAESVSEPESTPAPKPRPDPSLRTGPKTGNRTKKKKRKIQWFKIWRAVFWAAIALVVVTSIYRGIQGWLGQDFGYLALAASLSIAAFALDQDWKRMRKK